MQSQYKNIVGDDRSIIVFTLHKSASTLINLLCNTLSDLSGLQYYSPHQAGTGIDARALLTNKEVWRTKNSCFAPVRFYVDVPDIEEY